MKTILLIFLSVLTIAASTINIKRQIRTHKSYNRLEHPAFKSLFRIEIIIHWFYELVIILLYITVLYFLW